MRHYVKREFKEATVIPALRTVERRWSSILKDALHAVEHLAGIPGRKAAAAKDLFDTKSYYEF